MTSVKGEKQRYLLWDIFKGFGIVFIVFGHTGKVGGAIVYLFHLALFFFVTGYFFNEEKYGRDPFRYLGKRIKGTWPRYMLYCIFFALTHNYCVIHGLMTPDSGIYDGPGYLRSIMSSMVFERPELYSGPMWFVPLWLLGSVLFAGVIYLSNKISGAFAGASSEEEKNPNKAAETSKVTSAAEYKAGHRDVKKLVNLANIRKKSVSQEYQTSKNISIVTMSLLCLIIGLYAVDKGINVSYHMELAFVIEPFFVFGYFMKKYLPDWQEKLGWPIMIPAVVLIFFIFNKFIDAGIWFDLASQYIFGGWYYVGGVLGIIFTIMLSKLVERAEVNAKLPGERAEVNVKLPEERAEVSVKLPEESKLKACPLFSKGPNPAAVLLAAAGKYSFDIMALHIFVFKMLDMLLRKFYYRDPGMDLSQYPSPLSQQWWVLYPVVPVLVPMLVGIMIDRIKSRIRGK